MESLVLALLRKLLAILEEKVQEMDISRNMGQHRSKEEDKGEDVK